MSRCVYLLLVMATGGTKFGTAFCPATRLSQLRRSVKSNYRAAGLRHFYSLEFSGHGHMHAARHAEILLREACTEPSGSFAGCMDYTPDAPAIVLEHLNNAVQIFMAAGLSSSCVRKLGWRDNRRKDRAYPH